jgi:peroxiredoxin
VDHQEDIVLRLFRFQRREESIGGHPYIGDQLVILENAKKRVLVIFRRIDTRTFTGKSKGIKQNLQSVVDIPATVYEVSGAVASQKEHIDRARMVVLLSDEWNKAMIAVPKAISEELDILPPFGLTLQRVIQEGVPLPEYA